MSVVMMISFREYSTLLLSLVWSTGQQGPFLSKWYKLFLLSYLDGITCVVVSVFTEIMIPYKW